MTGLASFAPLSWNPKAGEASFSLSKFVAEPPIPETPLNGETFPLNFLLGIEPITETVLLDVDGALNSVILNEGSISEAALLGESSFY